MSPGGVRRSVAALVAVAAVGLGLLTGRVIPDVLPIGAALLEWTFPSPTLVAVGAAIALLSGSALLAAALGPGRVAVPAALLALSWGALAPAIWSVDPRLRGASLVAASLLPAALLHLVAELRPVPTSTRLHRVTLAAYGLLPTLATLHVLSTNPFHDPGCIIHCSSAAPAIGSTELSQATAILLRAAWAAGGALVAWVAVAAVRRPAGRTATTTALALSAACGVLELPWALGPDARPALGPLRVHLPHLLGLRALVAAALGVAVLIVVCAELRRVSRLRELGREIIDVTPPRRMGEVMAARLGDPTARLTFFVPSEGSWVDEEGVAVVSGEATPGPAVAVQTATLRRDGHLVARLTFRGTDARAGDLEAVLGPATLLALEAERARAELLWRMTSLQAARRRVVETRDAARRRFERDLHDGAQHLLLAVIFALQEAVDRARTRGDLEHADALGAALRDVGMAAGDLRALARGIYPVLLGDAGLVPALEGLALASPVPTALDATPVPRLDSSTELTAYRAVVLALRAAGEEDPDGPDGDLHLRVAHDGARLTLSVQGTCLDAVGTRALRDRATALGGTMETVDRTLRLELPCA